MRGFLPGIIFALLLASCSTPAPQQGRAITQDEVYQIAVATVTRHEGWPASTEISPGVVACILCQPRLNTDGSWRVIVNRAAVEESTGNNAFFPGSGRIVSISRYGKVTRYGHLAPNLAN